MSVSAITQYAFTSGEWSPLLYGRGDLQKYASACSILENMLILPHGPAARRPGTRHIAAAGTEHTRLLPFVYNSGQAYILELTPGRVRFFRDGGIVLNDAGAAPYEIPNPWTWEEILALSHAQSADVMYLCCGGKMPRKLARTGTDRFSLTVPAFSGAPSGWNAACGPAAVAFHQQRLWFAGAPSAPQQIVASKTAAFENLSPGTDDSSGISFHIASGDVEAVRWLVSYRSLTVGTAGGEWIVSGGGPDAAITPQSVTARRNSRYGTAPAQPCLAGPAVLHLSADRRRLMELAWSFQDDACLSTDLSLLAEHLTRGGLRQTAWAPDPDGIVWAVTEGGELLGLTYLRSQDVTGWHRHPSQGKVLSCAVIPGEGGSELWLAVSRANGVGIELLPPRADAASSNHPDCRFLDASLLRQGAAVRRVSGLEHLEGRTVQILADGAAHPETVVRGGAVNLDFPAALVVAGLACPWRLAPMQPESPAFGARSQSRRLLGLSARLYRTLGLEYGLPDGPRYSAPCRDVNEAMDGPPAPFSGDVDLSLGRRGDDCRCVLSGSLPLPATVLSLTMII